MRQEAEELAGARAEPAPEETRFGGREEARAPGQRPHPSADDGSRFGVFQEAWDVADASPIGAVISAWLVLEDICRVTLQQKDALPESRRRRPGATPMLSELIPALKDIGLSQHGLRLFDQLRHLRNKAVHGDVVTRPAARDFVETCRFVAREVYGLR